MNKVWMLLLVFAVVSACMSCTSGTDSGSEKFFRIVEIPKREHGYSNFESIVISSQTKLDSFLEDVSFQENMGWNNRGDFEEALNNAAIDFKQETLALLRHTEGSGSIKVTFETPVFSGEKLLCRIKREVPEMGTDDMAFYCFAIVVRKNAVKEIELTVDKERKLQLLVSD